MSWWKRLRRTVRGGSPERPLLPELQQAPGPSPWYLRGAAAPAPGFSWQNAGAPRDTAGAIVLTGPAGPVLMLDFHNHAMPLDQERLLVWHQQPPDGARTGPIVLRVFHLRELRPLEGDGAALCASMRGAHQAFLSATPPALEFAVPTTVVGIRQPLTFPEALRHIPELLILCASSGIRAETGADRGNLGLMVASPRDGAFEIFPQDWFNEGGFDYGYEWVTRVARDPRTGRIHGDGIRIQPFVLDDRLRRLR